MLILKKTCHPPQEHLVTEKRWDHPQVEWWDWCMAATLNDDRTNRFDADPSDDSAAASAMKAVIAEQVEPFREEMCLWMDAK